MTIPGKHKSSKEDTMNNKAGVLFIVVLFALAYAVVVFDALL